jgi:ATP-dependent DNA ligase
MKKLFELIKECREKGIPIPDGAKVSKQDLICKLANYHLEQDQRGIPPLKQVSPQLARDITELSEKKREEVLKSDRFACGEKKNGIRGILHIRPEGNRFTSRNRCSDTYLLNELTENVPHLCNLNLGPWKGSIFDGELYLPSNFVRLDFLTEGHEIR